jgi:hypothetical protein
MRTEALLEALSRDLKPMHPRSLLCDAIALCVMGAVELAAFSAAGLMRPDMHNAMEVPSFWWKMTSMGIIAVSGVTVALVSADPTRSPRTGSRWLAICISLIFTTGWLVNHMQDGFSELVKRLDWQMGLQCTWKMVALSVPLVITLGILLRRGAPIDRFATSLAAALGSAAWGAFLFVFACPSDDPLYIAVWYTVGCGIVTLVGRSILARLIRW